MHEQWNLPCKYVSLCEYPAHKITFMNANLVPRVIYLDRIYMMLSVVSVHQGIVAKSVNTTSTNVNQLLA